MNAATQSAIETANDALLELPPSELAACARLLAVSIAHHRAKFGVVPLSTSRNEIERDPSSAGAQTLRRAGEKTFDEVLSLVREAEAARAAAAAGSAAAGSPSAFSSEEQRRQMRISVTAPVKVSDLAGEHVYSAKLHNISWGGAAVRCPEFDSALGERMCLLLPAAGKRLIRIEATVLRDSMVDGEREYGLRFDSLDPDDEDRLLEVLKILMASPDPEQRRSEVRLVQRLEVEYGDAGEFRATLEDISTKGMMLTVPDPIEIGESLLISMSSVDTPFGLNLRARVVHQSLVEGMEFNMYRVGLQFEHPSPRLHERISAILHELAILRPQEFMHLLDEEQTVDPA